MEKQPTPRKGTETFRDARMLCHCGNNPHPARGRKPKFVILLPSYYETTHTPQGDGNPLFSGIAPAILRNNPRPARGRKPSDDVILIVHFETTHTPQGDGNLTPSRESVYYEKQPTPRKGTETHLCSHCRNCWRNHPHPRQGTTDKKGA